MSRNVTGLPNADSGMVSVTIESAWEADDPSGSMTPLSSPPIRSAGLLLLLGVAIPHAIGAALDALLAVRFHYEILYGEGVVWEQALLMGGPRAYSSSTELPFIVFHYPPVYHGLIRAVGLVSTDLLSAGRIVSSIATGVFALAVAMVVWTAGSKQAGQRLRLLCAAAAALLILCVPNIRAFGFLMRVDMVANALGPIALLIAFSGRPTLVRTAAALTIATVAVYTKQSELAAGVTIFAIMFHTRSRQTLLATLIVGMMALSVLAAVQFATDGGFLTHLIFYNLNRTDLPGWILRLSSEWSNLPLISVVVGLLIFCVPRNGDGLGSGRTLLGRGVLVFFTLNLLYVLALAKSGSTFNYLNSLYGAGCMVVGLGLTQTLSGSRASVWIGNIIACSLAIWIAFLPVRRLQGFLDAQDLPEQDKLIAMIAAAPSPVISDDLALVIKAGQPALIEPAIVTELALTGRWNEQPLIDLIRQGGVAFAITETEDMDDDRRSPGVLAALRAAFPRAKRFTRRHWLHLPPIDP